MAAADVLARELDSEDVLGTGKAFRVRDGYMPDRKYLELADDLSFPRPTTPYPNRMSCRVV